MIRVAKLMTLTFPNWPLSFKRDVPFNTGLASEIKISSDYVGRDRIGKEAPHL